MSTSATIALKLKKRNKAIVIRVQYDGGPDMIGSILLEHFNTKERIEQLFELGNLKKLGSRLHPDPSRQHDLQSWQEDVCLVEDDEEYAGPAREFDLKSDEFLEFEEACSYIFRNGRWYFDGQTLRQYMKENGYDHPFYIEWGQFYPELSRVKDYLLKTRLFEGFHYMGKDYYCPGASIGEDKQIWIKPNAIGEEEEANAGPPITSSELIHAHKNGLVRLISSGLISSTPYTRSEGSVFHALCSNWTGRFEE